MRRTSLQGRTPFGQPGGVRSLGRICSGCVNGRFFARGGRRAVLTLKDAPRAARAAGGASFARETACAANRWAPPRIRTRKRAMRRLAGRPSGAVAPSLARPRKAAPRKTAARGVLRPFRGGGSTPGIPSRLAPLPSRLRGMWREAMHPRGGKGRAKAGGFGRPAD